MEIEVVEDYETFSAIWQEFGYTGTESKQFWALLDQLPPDELLIELPGWLAEEKVGYVDGATPTSFVGTVDQETEKAILFVDSAAARPLSQIAHRIRSLDDNIEKLESKSDTDASRLQWLRNRQQKLRNEYNQPDDVPSLSDEWLPKSQLEFIGRRSPLD